MAAAVIEIAVEDLTAFPERKWIRYGGKRRREGIREHRRRVRAWDVEREDSVRFFKEERGIFEAACEAGGQDVHEARAAIARRAGMLEEELEP